jgi:hypothetical protein
VIAAREHDPRLGRNGVANVAFACTVRIVVLLRRAAALFCGLVLLHLPARAAVLLHEYALRGTLADAAGGDPLTDLGGQITALGYVFAANQGLWFSSRDFSPSSYSIELSLRLNTVAGTTKILDFHNLTAEPGLYQTDGRLAFNPATTASSLSFTAGTDIHLVLTRDAVTNLVTTYVNGHQQFSFVDGSLLSAPPGFSNKVYVFVNDSNESNGSGGTANYLRIFNGVLTAGEVSALIAAGPPIGVPEPSTFLLLAVGGVSLAVASRRRRRRTRVSRMPGPRPLPADSGVDGAAD